MRRREFIAGLGSAATWPLAARAQQPALPVIGYLAAGVPEERVLTRFRQGLKEAGLVEGQNVEVDYRWSENQYGRLWPLATELVRRQVAVIYAPASGPAVLAARAASATVPIVFTMGGDPVKYGLVASLNRPATNATGVTFLTSELVAKQLEMICEVAPNASVIGALINPDTIQAQSETRDIQEAARALGRRAVVVNARNEGELEAAFATLVEQGAAALVVHGDTFFNVRRDRIIALASRHALPAIYAQREFVVDGGLMNYGANLDAPTRIAAGYIARILKGERPADLPVQRSTKLELVVNLKTAKALGLTIPETLLATADEVIQ